MLHMIDRRAFSTALIAGAAASLVASSRNAAAQAAVGARNVVLVHGAYADGSCWSEVIARLQQFGLAAAAVQNPLTSLADDVAATRRILAPQDGPTVLVGHSWGGTVISEAGVDPKVSALVYVAARAGCRRGLHCPRREVSDATGQRRPRQIGRLRAVERGCLPQGLRWRYRPGQGAHSLRRAGT